ncbi:U1 small nuclear ribonucleoprotein component SNU71 [Bienertia sinuspersici]
MELAIVLDDNDATHLEAQKSDIGSANVVNVYGDTKSISGGVLEKESIPSESSKYKFSNSRKGQSVRDFFFNEFYSTPTCAREIGPLPTFDLLTPSLIIVLSDPISSSEGLSKDSFSGDQVNVDCLIKDLVFQEPDSGTVPELLKVDEKSSVINSLADDAGATVSEEHCIVTYVTSANDMSINYDPILKEYIDLVEEETDVDHSKLERLISDIEKSLENFSSTNEEIKKEFGEEDGKNVTQDVATSKMQPISVHKDEEIPDIKMMILLLLKQKIVEKGRPNQQRNKYLDELSRQECVLADFLFYSEYKDVSRLSIDEDNPTVIEENEELRHTLESSVLLENINPANLDIHVCMTKTDFLSLAPRTWLTGASIDACSYVINRREEEKPGNPRSIRHADLNDFDCGIYSVKAMEWYDGGNEKKDPITTLYSLYKEFGSMLSCYRFGKLQREQKETGGFEGLCFVVYNKAISLLKADKEKG